MKKHAFLFIIPTLMISLLYGAEEQKQTQEYMLVAENSSSIMTNSPITERSGYFKKYLQDQNSPAKDGYADGPMVIPVPVSNVEELRTLKEVLELGSKKEAHAYLNEKCARSRMPARDAIFFVCTFADLSNSFEITEVKKLFEMLPKDAVSQIGSIVRTLTDNPEEKGTELVKKIVQGYNHVCELTKNNIELSIEIQYGDSLTGGTYSVGTAAPPSTPLRELLEHVVTECTILNFADLCANNQKYNLDDPVEKYRDQTICLKHE